MEEKKALVPCTCPKTRCPRHGDCVACVAHHREHSPHLPPLCFPTPKKSED